MTGAGGAGGAGGATAPHRIHVVVPPGQLLSGGNVYDRRVVDGLRELGHDVVEHQLDGAWPRPDTTARDRLARTLADLPDGAAVLVDGLVAGGVPRIVVPAARRLALTVLVHLPLGEEPPTADLAAGEGEVLRAASAVIATSGWTARRLHARDGVAAAVAVPGVDAAAPVPGTDGVSRVVCVGALTPVKGQDLLVAALPDGLDCDLVGPTDRDPEFVAQLGHAIAGRRVRITGPRSRDDAFRAADLVVVPSRMETYGMVATEALARGIPVVAADVGGLAEALDGAGTLVPPEDIGALGAALRRWRDEPAIRDGARLSARSRQGTLEGWTETSRRLAAALPGTRPNGQPRARRRGPPV